MNSRDLKAKALTMIADNPLKTIGGAFVLGAVFALIVGWVL